MDSAVARALEAVRAGGVDAHTHALLAQMAVLRLLPEAEAAMVGALTMTFEGDERRDELAKVRRYLGDPSADIVPLQRELAGIVAEKGALSVVAACRPLLACRPPSPARGGQGDQRGHLAPVRLWLCLPSLLGDGAGREGRPEFRTRDTGRSIANGCGGD